MTDGIREYFERADDSKLRGGSDPAWLKHYADDICKYLGECKGKKVLDLGCGNGKTTQVVAEQTGAAIIGCDFSFPLLIDWGGQTKFVLMQYVCRSGVIVLTLYTRFHFCSILT